MKNNKYLIGVLFDYIEKLAYIVNKSNDMVLGLHRIIEELMEEDNEEK